MSKVFIVMNVRDDTESKYPSIVFLSICFAHNLNSLIFRLKVFIFVTMIEIGVSITTD